MQNSQLDSAQCKRMQELAGHYPGGEWLCVSHVMYYGAASHGHVLVV